MKKFSLKTVFYGCLAFLAATSFYACSQHSAAVTNVAYHNLTAHYNAYFLANEKIAEAEKNLFLNRKDDYTRLLDVVIPMDSNQANAIKSQADYAFEKASLAVQRHRNSKWVDDSYLLIAKARHLQMDYPNAIETYKYVNTESKSTDAQHQALIGLLRAFNETKDYNYGRVVIQKLRREKLSKRNLVEFYLARAQYHHQQQEYDPALAVLRETVKRMHRGERKARTLFVVAQLYHQNGRDPEAYKHYLAALRNNPSYELAFHAQLNLIQVFQTKKAKDSKRLMAYFRKMLRDTKNAEYKDKIYYQMALYEYKAGRFPEAIEYLKKSVQASTTDATQKGYAYLKLGEIYFEKLQRYPLAKAYYDSTIQALPNTVANYEAIAKRQQVLDSFVQHLTTIQTEDSLQRLAKLEPAARDAYFDKVLDEQEKREKELAERKNEEIRQQANVIFNPNGPNAGSPNRNTGNGNGDGQWYFYNTAAVSQGRTAFARKWGNRPLEDNWRRSTKERELVANDTPDDQQQPTQTPTDDSVAETAKPDRKQQKESMLAALPLSDDAMAASNKKMEEAYFKLGKVYDLELQEPDNALKTYGTLLERFPENEYKPEVYYSLYLLHKNQGNTAEQDLYKDKLIAEFPGSSFTRLVQNPNYLRDGNLADLQADKAFAEAYQQFEYQNYAEADRLAQSGLQAYDNATAKERFEVLRIRIIGKTQNINAYRDALNNFINNHPESTLLPYVQNLLKATDGFANRDK